MADATRPKSHTGDYNIKRRLGKGFRSSKKTSLLTGTENSKTDRLSEFSLGENLSPYRSSSLNTLPTGQVLLQPRMAQLETLEAKMARIENSLSTTPRKKKFSLGSNGSVCSPTTIIHTSHTSPNLEVNVSGKTKTMPISRMGHHASDMLIYKTSSDINKEIHCLKTALKDKENVIKNLKGQLNSSLSLNRLSTSYLQSKRKGEHSVTEADRQAAEVKMQKLKDDVETKSLLIKNIKLDLERLDITDNIDVRIQQAELEYQLGREELNLLSILEEIQSLKLYLEECDAAKLQNDSSTLFNYIQNKNTVTLHAAEIMYDPKSPRFGATCLDDMDGLYIDWTTDDSGLKKGDRFVEINGKYMFQSRNRDELSRLLSISPNPAQIVVVRIMDIQISSLQEELNSYRTRAGEAEKMKDGFRSDNVRLTHRISYLEEQVSELLNKISDEPRSTVAEKMGSDNVEIFQKGSKVTLVNSPKKSDKDGSTDKEHSRIQIQYKKNGGSVINLNNYEPSSKVTYTINSPMKNRENYMFLTQRKHREHTDFRDDASSKSADFSDANYLSLRSDKARAYDSETGYVKGKGVRPIPPQKPLRLSLHKGCSLQSVKIIDKSSDRLSDSGVYGTKSPKRSHHVDSSTYNQNMKYQSNEKWC